VSPSLELFGTPGCPFTAELRQELEWDSREFVEHDVEGDPAAFARLTALTGGQRAVPVLVEDGRVLRIGFEGRTCMVAPPAPAAAADTGPADS
jgi:mycoredoxin